MRKTFLYLSSFLILFNACGYVVLYMWANQEQELAYGMESGSGEHTHALLTFHVTASDISSGKVIPDGDHEWYVNGKLYDVLHSKREGNVLVLTCYHDGLEEKAGEVLAKNMDTQLAGRSMSNDHSHVKADSFKDVKFRNEQVRTDSPLTVVSDLDLPLFVLTDLRSPFSFIESPPPQDTLAS